MTGSTSDEGRSYFFNPPGTTTSRVAKFATSNRQSLLFSLATLCSTLFLRASQEIK